MNRVENKRLVGAGLFCAGGAFIIVGLLSHHLIWFGLAALKIVAGLLFLTKPSA